MIRMPRHFSSPFAKRLFLIFVSITGLSLVFTYFSAADDLTILIPESLPSKNFYISGKITPLTSTNFYAGAAGTIKNSYFSYGQHVRQGQPIMELVSVDAKSQLAAAEIGHVRELENYQYAISGGAVLDKINAQKKFQDALNSVKSVQKRLSDTTILFDKGIVPRGEVDSLVSELANSESALETSKIELSAQQSKTAENAIRIARLNLQNAVLKLEDAKTVMDSLIIRAPHNGVILPLKSSQGAEKVEERLYSGRRVNKGDSLFTLSNQDTVGFTAEVDLTRGGAIKLGDQVIISARQQNSVVRSLDSRVDIVGNVNSIVLKDSNVTTNHSDGNKVYLITASPLRYDDLPIHGRVTALITPNSGATAEKNKYYKIPNSLLRWQSGRPLAKVYTEDRSQIITPVRIVLSVDPYSWVEFTEPPTGAILIDAPVK